MLSCHGMLRSASLGSLSGSLDGLSGSAIASFGVPFYVHVIAIVYRQGTVYGSTGPCGELRGNVV